MKWCWHKYKLDLDAEWKQVILKETETGRWIRNLHPHKCIKCGKTKYWYYGKDWVWKGRLSLVEFLNKTDEENKIL